MLKPGDFYTMTGTMRAAGAVPGKPKKAAEVSAGLLPTGISASRIWQEGREGAVKRGSTNSTTERLDVEVSMIENHLLIRAACEPCGRLFQSDSQFVHNRSI